MAFDLRSAPGSEGPTTGPEPGGLPITVRVVDAHLTHWRYVPCLVADSPDWVTHRIDVRDLRRRQWEEFKGDGNSKYRHEQPDFSILVYVVLELGVHMPGRPRVSSGRIDVADVRLVETRPPATR